MSLSEIYTRSGRVFQRKDKKDPFDYSDGNDTENYLLQVIENAKDLSLASVEWQRHIRDWPTKYHLSPSRADLLRPFLQEFKNKNILEVGCGCGAITRFLGEAGAHVTALEGSRRRATITAARCRDLPNVDVVCDNFQDFAAGGVYDFVILVGVLEYSSLFIDSEDPTHDMLVKCGNLLAENGIVIAAIENKLGLKYWSGAPQDHLGKPFSGTANRYNPNTPATYGRLELRRLFNKAGLPFREMFFPFPDYKFPSIIIRETTLDTGGPDLNNLIVPATDHHQFAAYYPKFATDRAWRAVIQNGLVADMSNSFMVVASRQPVEPLPDARYLAFIYSSGRYPAYRKANTFVKAEGTIRVERALINSLHPVPAEAVLSQQIQTEPYIPGSIYFLEFQEIISKKGWKLSQLSGWCNRYYEYLRGFAFRDNGIEVIDGSYLDLTPFNLLETSDGLRHFDQEWIANEPLPLRYLLFRGLYFCFSRPLYFMAPASGTPLGAFELITALISFLGIDTTGAAGEFCNLEGKFFSAVSPSGDFTPENFEVNLFPVQPDAIDSINGLSIQPLRELATRCYYAGDNDFSEMQSISAGFTLHHDKGTYKLRITELTSMPNRIKLRFSDKPGVIKMYSVIVRNHIGEVIAMAGPGGEEPMQVTDIIPIAPFEEHDPYVLLMFAGEPSLVLSWQNALTQTAGYLDVSIEMALVEQSELLPVRHSLANLLAFDNFSNDPAHSGSVRDQLADIVQRLARDARADLESQLQESEKMVEVLAANVQNQLAVSERIAETEQQLGLVRAENDALRKSVEWYKRTYEDRSILGVIYTRFRQFCKSVHTWILHLLLNTAFVQNRYAVRYMLEYTRDNGLKQALRSSRQNFRVHGFRAVTNARQLALAAMDKATKAKAPKPVDPGESEIYPVQKMQADINNFLVTPLISVIMPTYNTKPALLKLAIESVQFQTYENWELCIVDDGSTSPGTIAFLKKYASTPKVKIRFLEKNIGIAGASNACIDMSSGDYLALFDHDDELTPDALFWICKEINEHPDTDIIYTDECKKDEAGEKSDYFLKPDWSPQLLLNMMYVGHLTVYNKNFLLSKVGLFRPAFDFSQDYDLMLRATEQTTAIRHINRVLYFWRQTAGSAAVGDKPYARQTNISALEDALRRRQIDAEVIALTTANRVKLRLSQQPIVSIIVPTDSMENLVATIESIAAVTDYRNYEIVPVTNSKVIAGLATGFHDLPIHYVRYDKPYNFSDKCNAGAEGCHGNIFLFLNDDVRPLQPDWIQNTIEYLFLPGVGGVSPKLVYEDDSIQYAGMVTGVRNFTGTSFHCYPRNSTAYINFPQLTREVSILSGACLAMRKELFLQVGGFDAINTPSAHSDVDLSFKLLEAGYRCIYTPYAELRHIGHLSLKSYDEQQQKKKKKDKADIFLLSRWPEYIATDTWFPSTMRDLLYHDSPEPWTIYPGNKRVYQRAGKDIILVCHDLTRSGAPIMLYNICTVLLKYGYFVVVCCAKNGPLRDMYRELGVTVIIDPLILQQHHSFERFAINFDYILCNTVVNWPIVRQMQHKVKTIWWLQEAKVIDHFINEPEFMPTLSSAKHIIGVSDYSLDMVRKYNRHYTKIYNACYDFYQPLHHATETNRLANNDRVIFAIVGSIESRKGHDLLFEALDFLDNDVIDKLKIQVIGRVLDPAFERRIRTNVRPDAMIHFTGEIPNTAAVKLVEAADVILCPSRDDPFPVVLVEGFCMAKTCVVSDHTGFAELITHGENGFVFPSEDAEAFAAIIRNIVIAPGSISKIGLRAREVYLRELSIPVLERRLTAYIDALPEPDAAPLRGKAAPGKPLSRAAAT